MFLLPALVDRACLIVVAAMPTAAPAVSVAAMEAPPSRSARLEHTQVTGTHLATIAHQALSSQTLAKTIAGIAQPAPTSLMKVKLAATNAHQAPTSLTKVVPRAPLALSAKRLRKDRRLVIKSPAVLVPTFHPAAATLAQQARTPAQEPPAAAHVHAELTAAVDKHRAPIVLLARIKAQVDPAAACNVGQARIAAVDSRHARRVLQGRTTRTAGLLP
jgi:hypothetical protein